MLMDREEEVAEKRYDIALMQSEYLAVFRQLHRIYSVMDNHWWEGVGGLVVKLDTTKYAHIRVLMRIINSRYVLQQN